MFAAVIIRNGLRRITGRGKFDEMGRKTKEIEMRRILFILIITVMIVTPLFSKGKIQFDISYGISSFNRDSDLFLRDRAAVQWSEWNYNYSSYLSYSIEENLEEIKRLLPFRVSGSYELKNGWSVLAGLEWSSTKTSSEIQSVGNWETYSEYSASQLDYKLSYVMPFIGIEKKISFFSLYSGICWNFAALKHTTQGSFSLTGNPTPIYTENYDTKGRAPGAIFGVKFRLKVIKGLSFHIKLEGLLLKIPSFSGSFDGERAGPVYSQREGYIYTYADWATGIRSWDLFSSSFISTLAEGSIRDPEKMGLSFSSLRIILGISF
jgi:hypothetical protein